jgi:hypothetical protein
MRSNENQLAMIWSVSFGGFLWMEGKFLWRNVEFAGFLAGAFDYVNSLAVL